MATETLACAATIAPNNWTLLAGSTKVVAVASPDDESTTCIASSTTNGTQQQYTLASSAIPAGSAISSVAVTARCRGGSAQSANYNVSVILGANTSTGANQTAPGSASGYANTIDSFATKPGGGAWSVSDLASLQVRIQNAQSRSVQCTTLYVTVTYTPAVSASAGTAGADVSAVSADLTLGALSITPGAALVVAVVTSPDATTTPPGGAAGGILSFSVWKFAVGAPGDVTTLTPGIALCDVSAVGAGLTLGGLSVAPGTALVDVSAVAATGSTGSLPIDVSPGAALVDASGVAPAITLGAVSASAGTAGANVSAVSASVVLGGVTMAAGLASVAVVAISPAITPGELSLTPGAALVNVAVLSPGGSTGSVIATGTTEVLVSAVAAGVSLGAVAVAAGAASIAVSAVSPSFSGTLDIAPGVALVNVSAVAPAVSSAPPTVFRTPHKVVASVSREPSGADTGLRIVANTRRVGALTANAERE